MDNYERKNRIAEALDIRNMKQVELVEKTGLSKAAVNNWIKQRWQPKQTPLYLMSKALNVNELWLAGYDVPMERKEEQTQAEELANIINVLRNNNRLKTTVDYLVKLDDDQLLLIESMVNQMKKD